MHHRTIGMISQVYKMPSHKVQGEGFHAVSDYQEEYDFVDLAMQSNSGAQRRFR